VTDGRTVRQTDTHSTMANMHFAYSVARKMISYEENDVNKQAIYI